jgi:hypothetical protein
MNNICMTVLTDGRKEYISKALPTWIDAYDNQIEKKFIIDDSGDSQYREWLASEFPSFTIVPVSSSRGGYVEAMRKVFFTAVDSEAEYCLHIEDDFILHKPFIIDDVISVLNSNPSLSQMSFMRQPWYTNEIDAGGVIEALENQDGAAEYIEENTDGKDWTIHKGFWTCNPSIFPIWTAKRRWPDAPWSEMKFGQKLFSHEKSCGIWGNRKNWVCVEHIGRERNGTGY